MPNLFATQAQLTEAGFVLVATDGRPSEPRQVWEHLDTGLLAHRYPDGMVFGYLLDGADKLDADEELADHLELHSGWVR